jgi:hypothetical protein
MPSLKDYSVKFGRDPRQGLYFEKAIPFFYSLVNHNDVDWVPQTNPLIVPDITTYAVPCLPAAMTPHYVRLDPDYNYKLIAIKYSVYYKDRSSYQWYENINAAATYNPDVLPGTPYNGYIGVSLMVQGSGSQTLFGGQNVQAFDGGGAKIPLAISAMQGYESGYQAMRCEYLVPMQGIFAFEFNNAHPTKTLYVAAMMYGMKIRL